MSDPAVLPVRRRHRRVAAGAALLAVLVAVALSEWRGWPFVAAPLQRVLSERLQRSVALTADAVAANDGARAAGFQLRLIGGVRVRAPQLTIGAPDWSSSPHLLLARDVKLDLRYRDLWRAYRGGRLRIERLEAATLDGHFERRADGHASWQFGTAAPDPAAWPMTLPQFGSLRVGSGEFHVRDAVLGIEAEARVSMTPAVEAQPGPGLRLEASGRFRDQPLLVDLSVSGGSQAADAPPGGPMNVRLAATVGRAGLEFRGSALGLHDLGGRFSLKGPSLAAVGDSIGVTLPTTAAFRADGIVVRQGELWQLMIEDATVGASRLNGAFAYGPGRTRPMLAGRLGGSRLLLVDLGPVVGATPAPARATDRKGRVLPDRAFDLPAMRAMDANVLIDIADVDLNTALLEPLRPLRTHLLLTDGLLTLRELDARTALGRLQGTLSLDGRSARALWATDLRWDGVRLERWVRQARPGGAPPFVAGRLSGSATLQGQGRSTAEILASVRGRVRTELHEGSISHATIEAAGLDLAESLGLLLRGDDVLPVHCAVADLVAEGGVLRPRLMVVDTSDSAIWIDGSLSLATETLDLRAVVAPKDFSPLALRTPLRVRGSFSDPEVSVDKAPLGRKVASSLLLALLNPLAALLPLIDTGNAGSAERSAAGCQALMRRSANRRATPPGRPD